MPQETNQTEKSTQRKRSRESGEGIRFRREKKLLNQKSFRRQYRNFRRSGLGVVDSFFNSIYIQLCEKSVAVEKKRLKSKSEGESEERFLEHHGWILRLFSFIIRLFAGVGSSLNSFKKKKEKKQILSASQKRVHFLQRHLVYGLIVLLFAGVLIYCSVVIHAPLMLRAEINGKTVAIVDHRNTVEFAINDLEQNVAVILGENFRFPYEVHYTLARSVGGDVTDKAQITEALYGMIRDSIRTAAGLYVDGTLVAVCENEDLIQDRLEDFVLNHSEGKEGGIFNELEVVTQSYPTDVIITTDALDRLLEEMCVPLENRKDEIPSSPLPPEKDEASQPEEDVIPEVPLFSDVQKLPGSYKDSAYRPNRPQSVRNIKLDFYTVTYETYDTAIPFETVYVESDRHYTSMADVQAWGGDGLATVDAKVYFVEGKEVRREIIKKTVKRNPTDRVITVGTKVLPEDMGVTGYTQRFILPRIWQYGIYSDYGWREDGFHRGLDIPGKRGENLYAAASGTVIVAIGQDGYHSWRPQNSYSGYGYCVVIDHGNDMYTLYAHCNYINVTLGQVVEQGEKIAEIGNTGNSEGPHVHFEIIRGNTKLNPHNHLYTGTTTIYDKKE